MKNHFFCLVLVSVVLFQAFGRSVILLNFAVNKTFISLNLCENRGNALSKCHGKCYLKKLLVKEESNQKSPIGNFDSGKEINLFYQTNTFVFSNSSTKKVSEFFMKKLYQILT